MGDELRKCREEFEKYRDYEEINEFFLKLSKDEYLRAKKDGDNEEVAMMDASGIHAYYHGWIARGNINTLKHETVEELRVVVEKTKDCAKVSLKYGDKLLTSEDINSHNVLISDMFLSHIRGTVCNLIVEVVKNKPQIEE